MGNKRLNLTSLAENWKFVIRVWVHFPNKFHKIFQRLVFHIKYNNKINQSSVAKWLRLGTRDWEVVSSIPPRGSLTQTGLYPG